MIIFISSKLYLNSKFIPWLCLKGFFNEYIKPNPKTKMKDDFKLSLLLNYFNNIPYNRYINAKNLNWCISIENSIILHFKNNTIFRGSFDFVNLRHSIIQ